MRSTAGGHCAQRLARDESLSLRLDGGCQSLVSAFAGRRSVHDRARRHVICRRRCTGLYLDRRDGGVLGSVSGVGAACARRGSSLRRSCGSDAGACTRTRLSASEARDASVSVVHLEEVRWWVTGEALERALVSVTYPRK